MSSNPLNDLSKVYLDQVANVKKAENEADIQRWEEIGGPTPTNYKPTGSSAKLKTESVSLSDWRNDIFEAGDPDATQTPGFKNSKDAKKKVTEKSGINNTVVINPKLNEAIKEIGGELIEVAEVESDPLEDAIEYFYEEGINEEGIDQLIEEIGLEEFVDFVDGGAVELNEERAARRASVRAKKFDVVKKEVDKADAARKKAKKGEYAPSYAKKETDVTVYDDKPATKKKAVAKKPAAPKKPVAPKKPAAPAKPKKPVTKKVVKAVAKVKKTQPVKKATKQGLGDKIRSAYKAGVKRHRKATQGARVFGKGFASGAKKAVKFAKDVKKVVSEGVKGEDNEMRKAAAQERKKGIGKLKSKKAGESYAKWAVATHPASIDEDSKTREQQIQRKQLMLDRQKLQLRKRAMSQKNSGGSETEAQANVIANEGVLTMLGKKKKEKKAEKAMDAGARAKRMLARKIHAKYVSGSTENVPDDIAEAKVDTGRSDYGKASIRNYRRSGPGHGEPAMFDPENKRGKLIDKRREEHKARRGVKGAKVPAYKVSEGTDKALEFVKKQIAAKYGKDSYVSKDNPRKPQSAAEKAKVAAHKAKLAKQDHRDPTEKASDGRYSDRYSNRGSD